MTPRRVFLVELVAFVFAGLLGRLFDRKPTPRLYAIEYDPGDYPCVYVSTSPERALAACVRDRWAEGKTLTLDDVEELEPDQVFYHAVEMHTGRQRPVTGFELLRDAEGLDVCVCCDGHYCC